MIPYDQPEPDTPLSPVPLSDEEANARGRLSASQRRSLVLDALSVPAMWSFTFFLFVFFVFWNAQIPGLREILLLILAGVFANALYTGPILYDVVQGRVLYTEGPFSKRSRGLGQQRRTWYYIGPGEVRPRLFTAHRFQVGIVYGVFFLAQCKVIVAYREIGVKAAPQMPDHDHDG